jgi:hypothetical protein
MFVATNLWLWEHKTMVVGTNHKLWEQKPIDVGRKTYGFGNKTYGCGNKKIWLSEQTPRYVGTKTKYTVVGTNLFLWGQNYDWINKS